MKKKTGLKGVVKFFSVDFNPIVTNDILDIHKYLMKRTWYKIMFWFIKKIFIGLLTGLANGSNHTNCSSLSNQKYMTWPTLINMCVQNKWTAFVIQKMYVQNKQEASFWFIND